jgi:hypothetical protein
MADTFTIKRRDNLPVLKATLYSDSELTQEVDLTDADDVILKVGKVGEAPTINRPMDIIEPKTQGRVELQLTSSDTNIQQGDYQMEFEVNWLGGDISTYPKLGYLTFTVVADLDDPEASPGSSVEGVDPEES